MQIYFKINRLMERYYLWGVDLNCEDMLLSMVLMPCVFNESALKRQSADCLMVVSGAQHPAVELR